MLCNLLLVKIYNVLRTKLSHAIILLLALAYVLQESITTIQPVWPLAPPKPPDTLLVLWGTARSPVRIERRGRGRRYPIYGYLAMGRHGGRTGKGR